MTSAQLVRAVASITGERCCTIRARGFSLVTATSRETTDEASGLSLDCPGCGHAVRLTAGGFDQLPELAECLRCDAAYPYAIDEVYDRELPGLAVVD